MQVLPKLNQALLVPSQPDHLFQAQINISSNNQNQMWELPT